METEKRILGRDELKNGKTMDVSYDGSGVNMLSGLSASCVVIACIFLIVGIVWGVSLSESTFSDEFAWIPIVTGIVFALTFSIIGAICKVIAEIGRTALYQNHLLKMLADDLAMIRQIRESRGQQ